MLRLEAVGVTGLHLALVDLPGLISVSENEDGLRLVNDLVNTCLESSRTINLTVTPASNYVDTQSIIQRARPIRMASGLLESSQNQILSMTAPRHVLLD